jgi:hypothetical protein
LDLLFEQINFIANKAINSSATSSTTHKAWHKHKLASVEHSVIEGNRCSRFFQRFAYLKL